jgi:hypothetical protein
VRRFFFVKRERSHFLLDVPVLALLSPQLHGDVLRHTCVPPEPLPRNRRLSAAQHGPSLRSVHSAALTEDRTIPAHGMRARNRGGVDATVVQLSADSGAPEAYSTY